MTNELLIMAICAAVVCLLLVLRSLIFRGSPKPHTYQVWIIHSAGYFTPGVVFKVSPKITGYAGYSIGNQNASHGNHFFLLEVGYNFN